MADGEPTAASSTRARGGASRRRATTEPIAALAAVFAVCAGLTLYVTTFDATVPPDREANPAEAALTEIHDRATVMGTATPDRFEQSANAVGDHRMNATLTVDDRQWSVGPPPSDGRNEAVRDVPVETEGGDVRSGTLRVVTWP